MEYIEQLTELVGSSFKLVVNPHKKGREQSVVNYITDNWPEFGYNSMGEDVEMEQKDSIIQLYFNDSKGVAMLVSHATFEGLLNKVKHLLEISKKKEEPKLFEDIDLNCCSIDSSVKETQMCLCGSEEGILRMYVRGKDIRDMTEAERVWCVDQADWAGQGEYKKEELEQLNDKDLAYTTLCAWSDYANSL